MHRKSPAHHTPSPRASVIGVSFGTRISCIIAFCFLGLVRLYQLVLSPVMGPNCRYYPSCSAYALEAVRVHGFNRGAWLALKRIFRCHPWTAGGVDPVPPSVHSLSSLQEHPCHHGK